MSALDQLLKSRYEKPVQSPTVELASSRSEALELIERLMAVTGVATEDALTSESLTDDSVDGALTPSVDASDLVEVSPQAEPNEVVAVQVESEQVDVSPQADTHKVATVQVEPSQNLSDEVAADEAQLGAPVDVGADELMESVSTPELPACDEQAVSQSEVASEDCTSEHAAEATSVETPLCEESQAVELDTDRTSEGVAVSNVEESGSSPDETTDEETNAMLSNFKAQWEVDRFFWPAICGDVEEQLETEIVDMVQHLRDECESRGSNILVVTSESAGTGRTTLSLCIARELARCGLKTAMVDFDSQQPGLAEQLGVGAEEGIENLQQIDTSPDSICILAVEEQVSLLPLVQPVDASHCVSEAVTQMMQAVSQHHDMVLVDASPEVAARMAEQPDFPKFATVVVDDNRTDNLDVFASKVAQGETLPLGIIKNFAA